MNEQRRQQIGERRAQMPRAYRATYDRAVAGKSLRAAINSFCLECVCMNLKFLAGLRGTRSRQRAMFNLCGTWWNAWRSGQQRGSVKINAMNGMVKVVA